MKHHVSKNRQALRRTLIYSFMTFIVVGVVTVMTLLVLGFSWNRDDGKIEQGGLLQFASIPTSATVTLNGETLGTKTNTKSTVSARTHKVEYSLDKYRPWSKYITINPAQVGWVNYARLIPNDLPVKTVRTMPAMYDTSISPNRSWLVVQPSASQPYFQLVDMTSSGYKLKALNVPTPLYKKASAKQKNQFEIVEWSANNNKFLVKHTVGSDVEWLLVNREDVTRSVNLNATFELNPQEVVFAGDSDQRFFVMVGDTVLRVDLGAREDSKILAKDVSNFSAVNNETIVYVTNQNALGTRIVEYTKVDFATPQVLRSYAKAKSAPLVAMASYFNKPYIAIVYNDALTVYKGTLPTPTSDSGMTQLALHKMPQGAKKITMSRNGRFVLVEYADKYVTYDIELDQLHMTPWERKSKAPAKLNWLDDYIVWSDRGNMLRIYDFDGANQQDIMPVSEGFSAFLGESGKYLYGILQTKNGYELRRVQLIL